ncbi:MAG: hypothetical protein ACP5VS_03645 [Desulfomonilaceae bacterium]
MRRIVLFLMFFFFISVPVQGTLAADFPAVANSASQPRGSNATDGKQQFNGYVPPPPVRDTWPGGYKVIFHEMMNTLMDHIVGQY